MSGLPKSLILHLSFMPIPSKTQDRGTDVAQRLMPLQDGNGLYNPRLKPWVAESPNLARLNQKHHLVQPFEDFRIGVGIAHLHSR